MSGKNTAALPAVVEAGKHLQLYRAMSTAVAACHRVDECKDIIDKSVGLAAYYAQIKDTETERKFYQVRLRAWRRIGEMFSVVDISDCLTQRAKAEKIRASFDDAVVAEISDVRISEILQLMTVPDKSFEFALQRITRGAISQVFQHTPEFLAQVEANHAAYEKARREEDKKRNSPAYRRKLEKQQQEEAEQLRQEAAQRAGENRLRGIQYRHENELKAASEAALAEVGITLERKDRARMKSVVFLIKDEIHAVMRQAAFDQKITMQEVLRRGLKMWLIAHDYEFPDEGTASRAQASNRRQTGQTSRAAR